MPSSAGWWTSPAFRRSARHGDHGLLDRVRNDRHGAGVVADLCRLLRTGDSRARRDFVESAHAIGASRLILRRYILPMSYARARNGTMDF